MFARTISVVEPVVKGKPWRGRVQMGYKRVGIGNKILLGFLVVIFLTTVMATREYLTAFASLFVGAVAAKVLSWMIARRVEALAAATRVISEGDLTKDVTIRSQDELGDLADSFSQMVQSLREIVRETKAVAEKVSASAAALSVTAEEVNAAIEEIALAIEQIAKGAGDQVAMVGRASHVMRELSQSTSEIATRAHAAADAAVQAALTAESGGRSAQAAMGKMQEVFNLLETAAVGVKGFGTKTQQIGTIVDVITKIAHQTHLLALNATIEAARAGEHGRGFAVVADEVRKLAAEAGSSAERITSIIQEIREESGKVSASMEVATREIGSGREVLRATGEALQEIIRGVVQHVQQVQEISQLTEQQTLGAEALVKTMDEIAKVAEGNAVSTRQTSAATAEQKAAMEHMATNAQELSAMADKLRESVSRFRVGDADALPPG